MGQCCAKIMGEELGRRDSYRGAVKDTKKMAEADAAADSSKGGKKAAGKEKMEDLKKELTLDDHIITWEEFHVRHEGSNRVSSGRDPRKRRPQRPLSPQDDARVDRVL